MAGPLFYTQQIGVRFLGEVPARVALPVRRSVFQADEARFNSGTRDQHAPVAQLDRAPGYEPGKVQVRILPGAPILDRDGSKDYNISRMIRVNGSIERIKAEIEKCEVLCANCHRKEHHTDSWPATLDGAPVF